MERETPRPAGGVIVSPALRHPPHSTADRNALPLSPMTGTQFPSEAVHIIGAGLAGSEAAWQIAKSGIPVVLHEMRPGRMTEAHRTDGLAELACSNSFRSDDAANNAT